MIDGPLVVLFAPDPTATGSLEDALRSAGYRPLRIDDEPEARRSIERDDPAAIVLTIGPGATTDGLTVGLDRAAREQGVAVFGLVSEPAGVGERLRRLDGWAAVGARPAEVALRLGEAVAARKLGSAGSRSASLVPVDGRLLSAIVHDIRNPLNVIGLTLRVIEQMPNAERGEIQEDLIFLRDNAAQIEKMLALLSDVVRLIDLAGATDPHPMDPRRFLEEVLADRSHKPSEKGYPARLIVDPSTPGEVVLDPIRARMALLSALTNAAGATDRPLQVVSSADSGRWSIRITVEKAPPPTAAAMAQVPDRYERLIGSAAERRGLDLLLADRLSRGFGGSIRLEIVPGMSSTIAIDWPVVAPSNRPS